MLVVVVAPPPPPPPAVLLMPEPPVPSSVDSSAQAAHSRKGTMIATAEGNRQERLRESGAARELVDRALERFGERIAKRTADQSIAALRASYETTARTQVEKLLGKHFPGLDDDRAELLRRFAERLAKHFAHVPATGLRELASAHGPGLVNEFFTHADAALARELEAALGDEHLFARFGEEKAS